uniref:Uncharacterized protein n=1 Tax=Cyprinus carpio TaxID=7962 RepID=A0A8C1MRX5_CYPCA
MASRSFSEEDLICPLCCDIFINPVLLSCNHSVCRNCIQMFWENQESKECPVCSRRSSKDYPPVHFALKKHCETFLEERRQKWSSGICSVHKGKLKLFCLDDQELVCFMCRDLRKHTNHKFYPADEIDAQRTERQIKAEFEELHQFLRNEEAARITTLREEEKQESHIMMEKIEETSKQISSLTRTIRDIEEQIKYEDISFLQVLMNFLLNNLHFFLFSYRTLRACCIGLCFLFLVDLLCCSESNHQRL